MLAPTLQFVVAPGLVGASTLAARRWGLGLGGLVSAVPAIVGPLLLIAAHEHGTAFAAKAAGGTLLGLVALSGFALAYGRTALRAGWRTSLAAGWAAAAGIAALLAAVDAGPLAGLAAATLSLVVAYCLLPSGAAALAVSACSWRCSSTGPEWRRRSRPRPSPPSPYRQRRLARALCWPAERVLGTCAGAARRSPSRSAPHDATGVEG